MKYWINTILLMLTSATAMAQDGTMADVMRSNGKIYVVVAVIMVLFAVIILNMIRLERKMNKIEKSQEL